MVTIFSSAIAIKQKRAPLAGCSLDMQLSILWITNHGSDQSQD